MRSLHHHREHHLVQRIGWLRAAVLGANDGIVSTASLIVGVAAAAATNGDVLLAGTAALVAGAMSMAAGEYVSVSSQSDTEHADLARERSELRADPAAEETELAEIYGKRGLDIELAKQVARELTSALAFSVGAAMPLLAVVVSPAPYVVTSVAVSSLAYLAVLGAIGAKVGGAGIVKATIRVTFWGAFAMAVTAGIGLVMGKAV
jgi:VIT1/CCC1 family predicted Fe2+/Mn2+ transporter